MAITSASASSLGISVSTSGGVSPVPYSLNGQTGGHFSLGFLSGTIAGALTAPNQVISIRWQETRFKLIPLRLSLSVLCTAFSSGVSLDFGAYVARSFTTSASGGTQINHPTKSSSSGMNSSIFTSNGDFRIASTTELTPGTQTLDANPFGTGIAQIKAVQDVTAFDLYTVTDFGQHPIVLNNNEGIVVRLETVNLGASNSIKIRGRFEWVETPMYPF